ncbi:MAG TPA: penicillin-binding transpeptidase domain-containing protein [Gammaproteobacteria bacterium]|nr:penicillin-binding transpeptidase domain-containing protein [Gammaproteobacteria bacterium]
MSGNRRTGNRRRTDTISRRWRGVAVLAGFVLGGLALEGRVLYLQLVDQDFLVAQGDNRYLRTVQISAHRGPITDRNGEPLAVSTPVDSIWANPQELKPALDRLDELAVALGSSPECASHGVDADWLARRVTSNMDREFVYLCRDLQPAKAADVLSLDLPGVHALREYRRYYPAGEVTGHVLGFTDVDDGGQEGLELEFDYWLKGEPGSKRVLQDRLGRVVGDVELIKEPRPGRALRTSIDLRLQYLAYRELKVAVAENRARSGSLVMLDPATGEVLAMVNQPSFNPNDRSQLKVANYRNRAATDIFEPGSSFKPFSLSAALEAGLYTPSSIIDTSPGYIKIGRTVVKEEHSDLGAISLTTILAKSSNVGAAKVALEMKPDYLWRIFSDFGIGRLTESGFPGESAGVLHDPGYWHPVEQATMAYGYGLSVTTLQLARAYAALAAGGLLRPVSFLAVDRAPEGRRVVSEETAAAMLHMMEAVVSPEGTGERAEVANYRIAGKTGTAWKASAGGYSKDRYTSVFAGVAPASHPRLVAVVVIDEPQGKYYGGDVSAPVFARVMAGALRLLAVPPDALPQPPLTVVAQDFR